MTAQMAAQYSIDITQGVFVYSVVEGGAGDKAGLRLGDVITKMNDTDLTSRQDMSAAMKSYRAGDTVTLTVYRNGQYITTELTFDAQPQTTGSDTEGSTNDSNGGNGGYYGQMPDNWQDFYNYFFGQPPGLMPDLASSRFSPKTFSFFFLFPRKTSSSRLPLPSVPAGSPGGDKLFSQAGKSSRFCQLPIDAFHC